MKVIKLVYKLIRKIANCVRRGHVTYFLFTLRDGGARERQDFGREKVAWLRRREVKVVS